MDSFYRTKCKTKCQYLKAISKMTKFYMTHNSLIKPKNEICGLHTKYMRGTLVFT